MYFFYSSRRRHTRYWRDWSSDVCSSDLGGHLAALVVGVPLDDGAELDLQPAGQVEVVLGLHDVGDAALAGLAVDPDDGLVAAADVLGVDRQVRHGPRHLVDGLPGRRRIGLQGLEALVDGVLVG